ncbi:MAG: NAD-dependent DNA ligase LigA [Planctomycetia bacterium]|nr:NAD-dependent DNA ligase LigA [Planctomycetia bacterium]
MTKAKNEAERLRAEIRRHDQLYYVANRPELSDLEYDRLYQQLVRLEQEHPDLVTPDSPTQRVSEQPVSGLNSATHRVPMLSIDNTYDLDELRAYGKRIAKLLPDETIEWVVEFKVDGAALSLVYEHGLLTRGATRGNGQVGDDVTHNVRTMRDLPLRLHGEDVPPLLEIRGEVYMTNQELARINQLRQEAGEELYANTRNVSAGAIRLLDPRIAATRHLRFAAHGVGYSEGMTSQTHIDFLREIEQYGVPATPHAECFPDFETAVAHCEQLIERLHELDFEVDGLVLKVNRFDQRAKLGATSKAPRWVVAYKFEKYEAVTRLENIQVQVGKTGTITPVAYLEPVELAGTTVSRASLHNADEIARKDVRIGDYVVVEKAGKIIPHIVRVELHRRDDRVREFQFPTACPECATPVIKDDGGVYIRCPNPECPAQLRERLRYFAGRNAMDIEGLGEKLIDQLVRERRVKSYGDLFRLDLETLLNLERMGEKSSQNLIEQIAASKARGLARLLNALSIRHVGTRGATVLAMRFGTIDRLRAATVETLSNVDEIGPVIAASVYEYLHSPYGEHTIDDLAALGVSLEATEQTAGTSEKLAGKTLVVTGTLVHYTRDEIERLIAQHGGRAASSVSKKTGYLVAGAEAGSKLAKAEQLGVKVITEDEFRELIQGE